MTRIGVIGTGWGARVQVPMFREAGLEVVAIAGHSVEKTRAAAAELGVDAVDDWRDLIARDLDLVTIVTPPSEHLQMASEALAAGKHVICEKPTALNVEEAEKLLAAARARANRITLIDHELRFLPSWREARRRAPELGGIRYIEVRYASPGRGDRARAWNWWSEAAHGGGIWGAVGSHYVDAVRYLAGEIEAVQASMNTVIAQRPVNAADATRGEMRKVTSDDLAVVNLRIAGGALATMTFSVVASGPDEATTMTIHGENGALRLTGEELLFAARGKPFERVAGDDLAKRPGNSPGGAFGSGTLYFGIALQEALDNNGASALAPAATFEDGLSQQRVLDAARRSSANNGAWETI